MEFWKQKNTQMSEFKLTNKAVEDLSKIWDYTFEVWIKKQADKYSESLITNCQEIADNPNLGKNYEGIIKNYSEWKQIDISSFTER